MLAGHSQKIVPLLVLLWLGLACAFGLSGKLEQASAATVAVVVWTLTGLVLLACWKVPPIQAWALTVVRCANGR